MCRSQRTLAKPPVCFVTVIKGLLGVALLVGLAGNLAPAWAREELFVTNEANNSVTVYIRNANGNVTPVRTLSGVELNDPSGLFVDTVNKELFVANTGNDTVTVYPQTWPALEPNTPPVRTLSGIDTKLDTPTGLFVDTVNGELFVANLGSDSVTVYPRTWVDPNTGPTRTLSGVVNTDLDDPADVAVDTVHNELFVANFGNDSITVYSRMVSGDTAPLRTLVGPLNTGLGGPQDLDVDTVHNELFVANFLAGSVTVYSRTASGDTSPKRTLSGVENTDLNGPFGLAVDTVHDELFVANFSTPSVTVYSRTASGDTGPTRTLSGGNTELSSPQFVAVTASTPIPTLSEWAQISMAALLAVGGLLALRRRCSAA